MLLKAYTIYDVKALVYHPPFFKPQDGAALRDFSDLCNDTNTTVGRHPADYILYRLGNYSDTNGTFESELPMRHVADGASLVRHQPDIFADLSAAASPNGKAL